jgi:hypothetical protein
MAPVSYEATVTREGSDWLAEVKGLPGAHAYARTLTRLRDELTDAIILSADLADDASVDIRFTLEADVVQPDALRHAFELAHERRELNAREARLHEQVLEVVTELVNGGYSVRDVAGALNVTPGRISQVATGGSGKSKSKKVKDRPRAGVAN